MSSTTVSGSEIKRSLDRLRSNDAEERIRGIQGLHDVRDDPRVIQVFEHLYEHDPDPRVRRDAWHALYTAGPSVPAPRPSAPVSADNAVNPAPTTRNADDPKSSATGDTTDDGLFLLDPANRSILARERRDSVRRKRRGRGPFVLATALVVVMATLWALAWPALVDWYRLRESGIGVAGTITALERDGGAYRVAYRFETAHDTEPVGHTGAQSVTAAAYNGMSAGDSVTVTYWPDDPAVAQIDAPSPDHTLRDRMAMAAMAIGGVALLLASLGLVLRQTARPPRQRVVKGIIVACTGRADADGDFKVRVQYRFVSPLSGKTLTGQKRRIRNDLRDAPLPDKDAPVAVYFGSDRHYSLM